jgi:hypothetical protein
MFRFTIRDVLWLTFVVAVLTAWGVDHWRQAAEIHQLKGRMPYFKVSVF